MQNLPVHWSEGLFLTPQHFQAADQHWNEVGKLSSRFDNHYNYGLREVEFSEAALANRSFQLLTCRARTKDGTLVDLTEARDIDRLVMNEALENAERPVLSANLELPFQKEATVTVFLAFPKWATNAGNVQEEAGDQRRRFRSVSIPKADETTGANPQDVSLKSVNYCLKTSQDHDLADFELLPIARIKRAGEAGVPALDKEYIPPILACDGWKVLQDMLTDIYDWIGEKIEVLAEQVMSRGITLTAQEPGDLDRFLMLMFLNQSYAALYNLASIRDNTEPAKGVRPFGHGVHPFTAYNELCRIIGQLSIFQPHSRRVGRILAYDHDDLGRIFHWAKEEIRALLSLVGPSMGYEQRFFIGRKLGMRVTIKSEWLESNWKWFVGVSYKHIAPGEVRELLGPSKINWKLGSEPMVDWLFQNAVPGVTMKELDRTPPSLPASGNWLYFELLRDNPAWKDVYKTETLAMCFQLSAVANRDNLEGQRTIIVAHKGKQAELEFSLFAVRQQV